MKVRTRIVARQAQRTSERPVQLAAPAIESEPRPTAASFAPEHSISTVNVLEAGSVATSSSRPGVVDITKSGGRPLDAETRTFMEPRFGHDFGHVRVHADAGAAAAARSINAQAYTIGRDVVFGAGQYAPQTEPGRRLLAHELTHVVQQRGAPAGPEIHRRTDPAPTAPPAPAPSPAPAAAATPAPNAAPAANPQAGTGDPAAPQPAISPEVAKKLAYTQTVLTKVGQLSDAERASLNKMVGGSDLMAVIERRDKLREELKQARIDLESSKDISGAEKEDVQKRNQSRLDSLTLDLEGAQLQVDQGLKTAGVASEQELIDSIKKFPELWKKQAKQIANVMLDQNLEAANGEGKRYDYLNQYSKTGYDDAGAIRLADREIAKLMTDLQTKEFPIPDAPRPSVTFESLQAQVAAGPPQPSQPAPSAAPKGDAGVADSGSPAPAPDDENFTRMADIYKLKVTLLDKWRTHGLAHPILYHPSYQPGYLDASGDENIIKLTGQWAGQTKEKIEKTRENIEDETISLWDLKDVPDLAFDNLGVARDSVLGKSVAQHFADKKSDAEGLRMAMESFAMTVTIMASAAAGPAGFLAGLALQGAVGVYALSQDISKAMATGDASQVAIDPDFAKLTTEEPDLVAVVMDIVSLGLIVADAVKAARGLRTAMAALEAGGTKEQFATEARKHLGDEWKARALADKIAVRARAVAPGEALEFFGDYRSAHRAYMEALAADPTLEVGIWRNRQSKKWVLGYGDPTSVKGPLVSADQLWELVKHHHPGSPVVATIRDRLPSAEDFEAMMAPRHATIDKDPARSMITWMDESGKMRYTTFGMDPDQVERYWVRYPDMNGEIQMKRFVKDPWSTGKLDFENWATKVENVELHGAPTVR